MKTVSMRREYRRELAQNLRRIQQLRRQDARDDKFVEKAIASLRREFGKITRRRSVEFRKLQRRQLILQGRLS